MHDLQHSSVISNCTTEGGEGIGSFPGTSNLSILANEVFNVGNPNGAQSCTFIHGIYDNSTGDIENNLIFHNAGFGINSHSDSQNIVNNTIFNQNAGGIWITGGTSGHNIINNIIYDVGIGNNSNQAGVNSSYSDDSPSNSAYTDNLIFQSSGSQANNWVVRGSGPGTTGYVNAAPQFVNYTGTQTGNYQLASSSPAVGAGTMNFAPGTDFTGSTRQAPIWMGAYQSGGSGGGGGGSLPAAPTGLTASVQ